MSGPILLLPRGGATSNALCVARRDAAEPPGGKAAVGHVRRAGAGCARVMRPVQIKSQRLRKTFGRRFYRAGGAQ